MFQGFKDSLESFKWLLCNHTLFQLHMKKLKRKNPFFNLYFYILFPITILLYLSVLIVFSYINTKIPLSSEYFFVIFITKLNGIFMESIFPFLIYFLVSTFIGLIGFLINKYNGMILFLLFGIAGSITSIFPLMEYFSLNGLYIGLFLGIRIIWKNKKTFINKIFTIIIILIISSVLINLAFTFTLALILGSLNVLEDGDFSINFSMLLGIPFFLIILLGIEYGLLFFIGLVITGYKPYLYIYYFFKYNSFNLNNNPYLIQKNYFFPFNLKKTLLIEAKLKPLKGFEFANFLYSNKTNNLEFASQVMHSAYAGNLLQSPLKDNVLKDIYISKDTPLFVPSSKWTNLIKQIKEEIISYEKETQITLKKERFNRIISAIQEFKQQTIREQSIWGNYYYESINKWIDEADKINKQLEYQQQNIEPVQRNIYRYGTPLHPNRDELIFLGRDDIKREISTKIFTNEQIPAFMIQGQRRVGKTSLINFLPELLGSRFRVVSFDCQGVNELTFTSFLIQLSDKIKQEMNLKKELLFRDEWTEDWNIFENFLKSIILEDDIKLLLVLDEYEVLHKIFEQKPKEAEFILGRIRHFLQHQNSISFIFVGLYTFSDLKNPNWSEYLVHYERFKVGYLNNEDSIKLITKPTKDFRLKYAKEVSDRLYYYTAGHPALIQLLCNRIVDISNKNMDSNITMDIVETVVQSVIKDKELYPVLIFWEQLCTEDDKATVREILAGKEVSSKRSLYKLEDYGFVVDGEIRVPIFKMWLERFEGIV